PGVRSGGAVDVCIRNAGTRRVALYGAPDRDIPGTVGELGGRPLDADLRLRFLRTEPRSALALVPDVLERATLFRPGIVGTLTLWILLAATLAGVPLLLALALLRATVTKASPTRYAAGQQGQPKEPV
ncbi:MAG: hypothetical protein M3340_19140, partial [Actinomycetota bacterium]|nr:hypothetical protein [Actinomycetota bacterium]